MPNKPAFETAPLDSSTTNAAAPTMSLFIANPFLTGIIVKPAVPPAHPDETARTVSFDSQGCPSSPVGKGRRRCVDCSASVSANIQRSAAAGFSGPDRAGDVRGLRFDFLQRSDKTGSSFKAKSPRQQTDSSVWKTRLTATIMDSTECPRRANTGAEGFDRRRVSSPVSDPCHGLGIPEQHRPPHLSTPSLRKCSGP